MDRVDEGEGPVEDRAQPSLCAEPAAPRRARPSTPWSKPGWKAGGRSRGGSPSGVVPARRPHGDETPLFHELEQGFSQVDRSCARRPRRPQGLHRRQEVLLLMVHDVLGTQPQGLLALRVAARGRDHPGAEQPRGLHRRAPHGRPGRVTRTGLADARPRAGHESVPGGEEDEREVGRLLEGEPAWLRELVSAGTPTELGVAFATPGPPPDLALPPGRAVLPTGRPPVPREPAWRSPSCLLLAPTLLEVATGKAWL